MNIPLRDPQDTPQYETLYTTPMHKSDQSAVAPPTEDTIDDYFAGEFEAAESDGRLSRCHVTRYGIEALEHLPAAVAGPLRMEMERRGVSAIEVVVIERN